MFCISLPGNPYTFLIDFHHNLSSAPPLIASFSSTLTNPTPPIPQDAVCTVQVYQNEVSGVKLLSWSLYYLSFSYTIVIYDRYAMHYEFIAPLLSTERFKDRVIYIPYTVFEIFQSSTYNEYHRMKQVHYPLSFFREIMPFLGNILQILHKSSEASQ